MEWGVWMKWIGTDKEIKKITEKRVFKNSLFFVGKI